MLHHTEVLAGLAADGRLSPSRVMERTITFHDPCYLGRMNSLLEEPRSLLRSIPGARLTEMEMSGMNSFCCGGGGGQMWLEEADGERRLLEARAEQALSTGADTIGVACPYCLIMLEDGLRARGLLGRVEVMDVAEILAGSIYGSGP